jgi:signal transduction histidine kinase
LGRAATAHGARTRVALLLAALVVALFLVAFESYRVVERELTDSAMARRSSVSFLAATVLSEKFDRLLDIGVALATRVRFRELVEQGKWEEAIMILRSVPEDFPFIDRVVLNDPEGTMRADVPPARGLRGRNVAERDWYQVVTETGRPYISRIYRRAAPPQVNVFVAAVPIRSRSGKALGILVLQVRVERFFEWTRGLDLGEGAAIYIVDRRGSVASHSIWRTQIDTLDYSNVPAVRRVLDGKSGVDLVPGPAGAQVVAYHPVGGHGWGVVVEEPARLVFALRDDQLRWMVAAYLLVLAFLGSIAYLVSRVLAQRRQAEIDGEVKKELERRVRERTAQLESANRELEGFSYSVSHDLRAPVRAIEGFTRILEEEAAGKLDDEDRKYLRIVRDNSRKMAVLIESLLEFSRLGRRAVRPIETDMLALATESFEELRAGAAPVAFRAGPMPRAQSDRELMRQVWMNLLSNAIKFSGGKREPQIEVGGANQGRENVYYVKDNGAGFDMRFYDKMFGVFQRLHGEHEFPGTGVGLALVQRIVERHGGRVWARGEVGAGATFYFSVPTEPGAPNETGAAS